MPYNKGFKKPLISGNWMEHRPKSDGYSIAKIPRLTATWETRKEKKKNE